MKKFETFGCFENNEKWDQSISRLTPIIGRANDIRSEFWRDYNRLLHGKAFRRLKHKTQVFHTTSNDHICTRIEHVNHVASVSYTICNALGINTELALAIAIGHDIGHAPFGHDGEHILSEIAQKTYGGNFWHEKNSLHFADSIEILQNHEGAYNNLNLSYAVRDGILSHCGEVDDNAIFPRDEAFDLYKITKANQYPPFTWEAAVVKIADKISYLGRDIEDALLLNILDSQQMEELIEILAKINPEPFKIINNTVLIHNFVINLCENSSPENGIRFSEPYADALLKIKQFNYKYIYLHPRLNHYFDYSKLIINTLFKTLFIEDDDHQVEKHIQKIKKDFPSLASHFEKWLIKYSDYQPHKRIEFKCQNKIIYNISKKRDYNRAIVEFISSMTDQFAVNMYQELIKF
jgi:dGTPase